MTDTWVRGDYLGFTDVTKPPRKTKRIAVAAVRGKVQGDESAGTLGYIEWFGRWRQYVFVPLGNTIYSAGCLADVASELKAQQSAWRDEKKRVRHD